MNGTKPLYRSKQERPVKRKYMKSKADWLSKIGFNNLLQLPTTPGGKLVKLVRKELRNMEEPRKIRTYIKEDYGVSSKQLISKSNPFPKQQCGDHLCMVCRRDNDSNINNSKGTKCLLSNVGYTITCRTCGREYIGTTSRNCKTRSVEHLTATNSTINRHVTNDHPGNSGATADQYSMRVTGHFQDPMTRQISEAVKIRRARNENKDLLNEKKEFNILRLVSLSAEYEE